MQRRVALVVGTRPEAIKMAPLIQEFAADKDFEPVVISTGQHSEMLEQVFTEFDLRPDIDLQVRRPEQSLAQLTSAVLKAVDGALQQCKPHAVLAHGDTVTTLGVALASFYRMVPLIHVEAGLRSGNRWAPYPEEINRRITSLVTDLHLAPTAQARQNLLDEGVDPATVVVTGNTVIDAMQSMRNSARGWADPQLNVLDRDRRRMLLFTIHRRESWGLAMTRIGQTMAEIADRHPDMLVVACVHANPTVRAALLPALAERKNVIVVQPQPYSTFLKLIERAHLVVTDSGGVQEECLGLSRPALVLRDVTERQEAVDSGGILLIGTDPTSVAAAIDSLWRGPAQHAAMSAATNPFGDGRAAERCVKAVSRMLGLTDEVVPDFRIAPLLLGEPS